MAVKIRLRRMGQQIPTANVPEDVSSRTEHTLRTRSPAYTRWTKKQLRNGLQTVLSLQKLLLRSSNRPESRNKKYLSGGISVTSRLEPFDML